MKKYYNADELLKLNCDINIIDGARGIGKSTDICRRGIQERIATAGQRGGIAYIRRKDKQITKATIESYIKEETLALSLIKKEDLTNLVKLNDLDVYLDIEKR